MSSGRRTTHVVLVPFPAHGHVAPHMQLVGLLHAGGCHVTLVHTELHHRRLLRAREAAVPAPAGFGVEVIPDGLSPEEPPRTLEAQHRALEENCLEPFRELLRALAARPGVPPPTCVVVDTPMSFASVAARDVGVPDVHFFTASASGLMAYLHFHELIKRGLIPLKEWLPGMTGMRLKDMPTFCRTTDVDSPLLRIHLHQMRVAAASTAVIINTFDGMEKTVVDALAAFLPPVYTVGPLSRLVASSSKGAADDFPVAARLRQEDIDTAGCMAWLDGKRARSVVYLSYGSHAAVSGEKAREFASGLARCGSPYLWVLRSDIAAGVEVGGDGLVVPWCAQETVLGHPAVGLFVTHCGWNSILESVVAGVPVLGWPMMSEQTTNCRQVTTSWSIGAELPQEAGGDEIAGLVREMMVGEKGSEAREKTAEWKKLAEDATREGGSSYGNLHSFVHDVLLQQ